jgi:atypical dual specificity phosphatase
MRFARVLPVAVHAAERYGSEVTYRADAGQKWSVARGRRLAQARVALLTLLRLSDRGGWVAPGVLGCAYPRTERALAVLSGRGVRLLVNLHERPHEQARLGRHDLREVHLPVKDFAAPSPAQVERGVEAILGALAAGEAAAVHCGGGLGRTGTLLACYLASGEGYGGGEAIRRVRALRPGSVETAAQAAAVEAWARRMGPTRA